MMRRLVVAMSLLLVAAQGARSEAQRALLTHENLFPDTGKAEVGADFRYSEFQSSNEETLAPYARYTIIKNLTLDAAVPYSWISPDSGGSENGFGDVNIGAELLAYQDIFNYPWVIPHADVSLQTGDQNKGLGSGNTVSTFGVSVGTTVYDQLHYVGDVSYSINGGKQSENPNNAFLFSGSIIWDISKQFAVLGEGRIRDEQDTSSDSTLFWQGGMVYKFSDNFSLGWYGGAETHASDQNNREDLRVTVKSSYTF